MMALRVPSLKTKQYAHVPQNYTRNTHENNKVLTRQYKTIPSYNKLYLEEEGGI